LAASARDRKRRSIGGSGYEKKERHGKPTPMPLRDCRGNGSMFGQPHRVIDVDQTPQLFGVRSRGLLKLAVNSQLNAADCQRVDIGLGLAGLDLVPDPELPFPDAGRMPSRSW
jgi:hypothetical protein